MIPAAVKGSVNKFYLGHLMLQKEFKFLFYNGKVPKAHLLVNGRKTIAAPKGASPGGFIINDLVLKQGQIIIEKGKPV